MISVIMPAYNAARFIESSAESVLAQTWRELELIIVNDGSTDDTAAAADAIARRDERVRVFNIENSGPANARNFGIAHISEDTEYITFIDSDDLMEKDALEYAMTAAEKGAEFVMMGFTIKNPDATERDYFEPEQYLDGANLGEALPHLYMANMLNQVWAKLYSARLIRENDLRFPDYRWGEDRLFNFDVLEKAKLCAVLPERKYYYIMQPGESLISCFYEDKPQVCYEADDRMRALCRRFGTKDDSGCRYMFVKSIFSCMTNLYAPSCQLTHRRKREYVRGIIGNEQVRSRSRGVYGGTVEKLMCAVMRSGIVWLNMLMFRVVYAAGRLAPKLFLMLKHKK